MSRLEISQVAIVHDGRPIIPSISFQVAEASTCALLGPSGSGKSSLLRVIAGIDRPASGRVFLDDADITDLPTHRRRIGLVFQDNQLFPHLSVGNNVAYGLRHNWSSTFRRSWPKSKVQDRVMEMLTLVGMADRSRDPVGILSGGEAKRVALARGLAPSPSVLLLDEPLTGLDAELHEKLLLDLKNILDSSRTTCILVTHDRDEATRLATSIVRLG
ncbi:MAG: ABC transporter ATP-binding protein [Ilumatobacteraceae bacterium]|jgi:thiamine transport system ATP-binding protein